MVLFSAFYCCFCLLYLKNAKIPNLLERHFNEVNPFQISGTNVKTNTVYTSSKQVLELTQFLTPSGFLKGFVPERHWWVHLSAKSLLALH